MRCHAEAPVTWPEEEAWAQGWQAALAPLTSGTVGPDGSVDMPDLPSIRLVGGTHLAPAATYRVAEDQLRSGRLEATIGPADRELDITWSPLVTSGRAELVVHGLDRFVEVRAQAKLPHLRGELELAPRSKELLRLRLRLDWLAVDFAAWVGGEAGSDRLVGDLAVRGAGLWRPTLAPLLVAVRGKVAQAFTESLSDLAESLARLPDVDARNVPAGISGDAEDKIRRGFEQIDRRLRTVASTVETLPWWRRTARRWRRELAALPPGPWPPAEVLAGGILTWAEVESDALARALRDTGVRRRPPDLGAVVRGLLAENLKFRRKLDEYLMATVPQDPPLKDLVTDANLDTRWLRTPWSAIRRLGGLQSDAEAQRLVTHAVSGHDGSADP